MKPTFSRTKKKNGKFFYKIGVSMTWGEAVNLIQKIKKFFKC